MHEHWRIVECARPHEQYRLFQHKTSFLFLVKGLFTQKRFRVPYFTTIKFYYTYRHRLASDHCPLSAQWFALYVYLYGCGYIERWYVTIPTSSEIPLFYFHARIPFFPEASDGITPRNQNIARGFSWDYDTAISKCFGEVLERAPYMHIQKEWFTRATRKQLSEQSIESVSPQELQTLTDEQLKELGYRPHDDSGTTDWINVKDLIKNTPVHIPAQYIYWTYDWKDSGFGRFAEHGTHGGAGYFSQEGAVLRALYEVVGRDGFYHHWSLGIVPEKINPASITNTKARRFIDTFAEQGFTIHLLDVTSPLVPIPSIFCVLERDHYDGIYYCGGAGCDVNINSAIVGAMEEACSMHQWLRFNHTQEKLTVDVMKHWRDQERLSFVAQKENKANTTWWLQGKTRDLSSEQQGIKTHVLEHILEECKKNNIRVFADMSQSSVLKTTGFQSVKVVSPDLIPMYHGMIHIPRLSLEQRKKYLNIENPVNERPHMYP